MTQYTLAVLGPVTTSEFLPYLSCTNPSAPVPLGLGGTPVNILCRELLERGHRLVILSNDPSVETEVVLSGPRLRLCYGPYRKGHARDFFRAERTYLRRALDREAPDVVHAHWTYEWALAAIASGLPYVITAHDAPINVLRRNFIPYRIARTLMAYSCLWQARRVVAVSPYVSSHLSRFGFYRREVEIVPNGLPREMFQRARSRDFRASAPTFASVLTGWGGIKNGEVAIRAFSLVRKELPDARLLLFGVGHGAGEAAEQWARARDYCEGVTFVGHICSEDLFQRLAADVDILVHPSLEESHGMAVIEAMAMGIPTIGGKFSGAIPWTLEEGRAGRLVDMRDDAALATAMVRLATDPGELARLGSAGKESVERRFRIDHVADRYEAIYRDLFSSRAKSRQPGP